MIPFFDAGENAKGIIAIGGQATGVIAIGQVALGVVAIGQMARGVIAVGQLSIGVVTIGQLSLGVAWSLAQMGIGARGRGFVLRVLPEGLFEPRRKLTTLGALRERQQTEGWVDLWLDVGRDRAPRLLHGGEDSGVELTAGLLARLAQKKPSFGVQPVAARVKVDERLDPSSQKDYRAAPAIDLVLTADELEPRPNPAWSGVVWGLRLLAMAGMAVAFVMLVAIPFVEAL